jgi:tetratricopeptide (TPR) repeat protein
LVKKTFKVVGIAVIICLFTGMSFNQSEYYKSGHQFNTRAYDCNQKNIMALNGLASDAFMSGKLDEAFGMFNTSIGIWKNALAYYYRGCIYEIRGQNDKAMADYSTLMQYLNTLPSQGILVEALNNRANQKVKRKDYEGAIVDLNIAAQIDTTSYMIVYNLGNYHLEMKRYPDAIACFTRAIALKSDLFEAYTNRGICRYELKDYEGALADYQAAMKINPFYQLAYNNTGVTLREMQRYDESIEYFNRTLSMNSKFAAAYYGRATVYLRKNDLEAAKADFIEALKLGYEPAKQFLREIPAKHI